MVWLTSCIRNVQTLTLLVARVDLLLLLVYCMHYNYYACIISCMHCMLHVYAVGLSRLFLKDKEPFLLPKEPSLRL